MTETTQPRTLKRKVAIVTGASRGIGATIAFDLASRGANVVLTYSGHQSRASADALIKRIESEAGSRAAGVQSDLRDVGAAARIVAATLEAFGPHIDVVVNNAAAISDKTLPDITPEHFDDVFHVNVRAPLLLVQAARPHLRVPARIISLGSVAARAGYPGVSMYGTSKAALEAYTRNWAAELGGDGTTANCVCPGPVQSEMLNQVPKAIIEPQLRATPLQQRTGKVKEIAEIVGFLAEPRSSWVTSQCISASGGLHMH